MTTVFFSTAVNCFSSSRLTRRGSAEEKNYLPQWREIPRDAMYKIARRSHEGAGKESRQEMWRLIKLLFFLVVIAGIGLVGYAYIADLTPTQQRVSEPVTLDVD
ncbi:hypothetical protein [Aliiruegeria sabulilitoris]|uniref:hypothetical protein n=1 Tax=Aliiruegeria sabulilitoris TaxID=1510458 RepID=UPI0013D69BA4|nr:hypothetical protein [Aliiruegeria sabulilitoris]